MHISLLRNISIPMFIIFVAIFINSCSDTPTDNQINQQDVTCTEGVTYPLTAGQSINVGTIHVYNDATNIYVTYTLNYQNPECNDEAIDAVFGTLHLWIGNDLTNVDNGGNCKPRPGKLKYQYNAEGLTSYTFTIPFDSVNIQDVSTACPLTLLIVAHAEVNIDEDCDDTYSDHQTAFGGNNPGNRTCSGAWWYYATYNVCCDFGPPPIEDCKTAFGKGGWVFVTSNKANPEHLPSLMLIQNRWGWAINLTSTGTTTYDIWAGAGLNRIANGRLVGTLTIVWNGTEATVTYSMNTGFTMSEVHLYAADGRPTTTAPGQYGNLDYFEPGVSTYTFAVPLEDTNQTDGVWLIAHAVVCGNY